MVDIFGVEFKVGNLIVCYCKFWDGVTDISYGTLINIANKEDPTGDFFDKRVKRLRTFYLFRMCNIDSLSDPKISLFLLQQTF